MKILTTFAFKNRHLIKNLNVIEESAFDRKSLSAMVACILQEKPKVIITRNLSIVPQIQQAVSLLSATEIDLIYWSVLTDTNHTLEESQFLHFQEPDLDCGEVRILQLLESINHKQLDVPSFEKPSIGTEITFIGAGIVNLISALCLIRKGYKIKIYSADPVPYNEEAWQRYGCTFAGNDARIFSFNESRHHHFVGDPLSTQQNDQYRKAVWDDGWLSCPAESLNKADETWIEEYESYPQWLFEKIQQEVVEFNKESFALWNKLRNELPQLFEGVGYIDQLFRVYMSDAAFKKGKKTEQEIGSYLQEINLSNLLGTMDCFLGSPQFEAIKGILKVKGFGINIHKFTMNVIKYLADQGAEFFWEHQFTEIMYDSSGRVREIRAEGLSLKSDYFVVSAGMPKNDLLRGTSTEGQIGAMIGCWITVPNIAPRLKFPLKISRSGYASVEAAAGANVIPGKDSDGNEVLYISSGHGFIGTNSANIHETYLMDLGRAAHETGQKLFPHAYSEAARLGWFNCPPRYCIRPWTPSCLGVFEVMATATGGAMIITGGHNTGGFAQSTSVAAAVEAVFENNFHSMHRLYNPKRLTTFFSKQKCKEKIPSIAAMGMESVL